MPTHIQIIDGAKSARLDGQILDVSGLNGSTEIRRLTVSNIERIGVEAAGDEWLFVLKAGNGGFSLVVSAEKKAEWETLVAAVVAAQQTHSTEAMKE